MLMEMTQAFHERIIYEISRSSVSKTLSGRAVVKQIGLEVIVWDDAGWRDDYIDLSPRERIPENISEEQ